MQNSSQKVCEHREPCRLAQRFIHVLRGQHHGTLCLVVAPTGWILVKTIPSAVSSVCFLLHDLPPERMTRHQQHQRHLAIRQRHHGCWVGCTASKALILGVQDLKENSNCKRKSEDLRDSVHVKNPRLRAMKHVEQIVCSSNVQLSCQNKNFNILGYLDLGTLEVAGDACQPECVQSDLSASALVIVCQVEQTPKTGSKYSGLCGF